MKRWMCAGIPGGWSNKGPETIWLINQIQLKKQGQGGTFKVLYSLKNPFIQVGFDRICCIWHMCVYARWHQELHKVRKFPWGIPAHLGETEYTHVNCQEVVT